ncbi:unnamed protein product [Ixodes persulcatus]
MRTMNKQNVGSCKMALAFFDVSFGDYMTGTCLGLYMKRAQQRPEDRPPRHFSAGLKIFPICLSALEKLTCTSYVAN